MKFQRPSVHTVNEEDQSDIFCRPCIHICLHTVWELASSRPVTKVRAPCGCSLTQMMVLACVAGVSCGGSLITGGAARFAK